MKATALAFVLTVIFASWVWSEDAAFVAPAQDEVAAREPAISPRAPGLQGMVAQFLRALNPLQLLNPFAPQFYGTGEANVSKDESFAQSYPSTPCLVVFGAEFE